MSILVSVDTTINHGISAVPAEQGQCDSVAWIIEVIISEKSFKKELGKNKVFVSVQGIPLKVCFSVGLHSE